TTTTAPPPPTTSTTSTTSTTGPSTTTSSSTTSTISASTTTTSTTTTSTFLAGTTTTTSMTVPGCSLAFTPDAVGCRIDQLTTRVSDASPGLGSSGPGLVRRVRHASDGGPRAAPLCATHRWARARAALRSAIRQLNTTGAKLRSRSARRLIPSDL